MNLKKIWQLLTPPIIRSYWSAWLAGVYAGVAIGIMLIIILFATVHFLIWGGFIVK